MSAHERIWRSNACKFTQPGGKVAISTKLMTTSQGSDISHPEVVDVPATGHQRDKLSATNLSVHNGAQSTSSPSIIVRIEVTDTGCGIGKKESAKLFCTFSPFVPLHCLK
jgi:signal transduction histidine kinase